MKLLIQMTILLTAVAIMGNPAQAKVEEEVKRLIVEKVTKKTKAQGIETYEGRIVQLSSIKKKLFKKKTVGEILKRGQIELTNGEILYPEEVEFALIPAKKKKPINIARIPDDERAPRDDD